MLYSTIFDKKNKVKVTNQSVGTWPHEDNCVSVKITLPDNTQTEISFLNKKVFALAEKMKEILSQEQINKLLPLIEDFGDEKYSEGGDSERMSNDESY